ncbi:MAG: aldehyde ferredoxin oxidoreductase family protein [Clostridia bacterium]|nr:aldehyde ferredoxin oxidoreductase family protein [Clostridia bacterium]
MKKEIKGYNKKIVKIDLTNKIVTDYPFSDKEYELFVGGKIMAAKIIYDNIKTKIDPLSPENMIVITTGPLNALGSPCSSRFNTSTISPLTGFYTSSNCGGNFGMSLKRAGYDAIIIVGKAAEKTYLKITADNIEFKNADALWGLTTGKAQEEIKDKGDKFVIGPAGENLVKYACVVSGERAAGRGGVGAVFGSKNLKGLVAEGHIAPEPYDKEGLRKVNIKWTKKLKTHPTTGKQLPALGTAGLVASMHARNLLATNNYRSGKYEKFEDISGETLHDDYLVRNTGCTTCPIRCQRVVKVEGKEVKGPEVETIGLFGSNILNNDMQSILDWNYYLDELGMDTISCANTISFAMELNEKGLWKNGLEFGKTDNILQTIQDIAYRRGIGDELAEGSKRLALKYGGMEFAMQAKGLELAAYEPRGAVGHGLGYAISNRGGCHLNGGYLVVLEGLMMSVDPYTTHGKAALCIMFQDLMEACSAGGNCLFTTYAFLPAFLLDRPLGPITTVVNKVFTKVGLILRGLLRIPTAIAIHLPGYMLPHTQAISKATGIHMTFGNFLRLGERGYNLERMIDINLGVTKADDDLPGRLKDELQISNNPKSKVPLDKLRKDYYKARFWDKEGRPTKKLIKRLKLGD